MILRLKQSLYAKLSAIRAEAGINHNTTDRTIAVMQQVFIVFTISVVLLLILMFAAPDMATQIKNNLFGASNGASNGTTTAAADEDDAPDMTALLAPAAPAAAANAAPTAAEPVAAAVAPATGHQQKWVTSWLSRRYRVANDATNMLVSTAYSTANDIKLDPLLILAVMAIESGLNPFAESPVGAKGLMQVMTSVHRARFQELGGVQAVLNPVANIKVGSAILKEYVTRGGSVEAGLKSYVGAAAFEHDDGYGNRVLNEYRRLKDVSSGKKVPITFPGMAKRPAASAPAKPHLDAPAPESKGERVVAL
jgi:hypothetical protein